jgi:hypothetical protein
VRASKGAQQAKRRGSDSVRTTRVAARRATSDEASAARPKKSAPAKRAKKAR